MRLIKFSSIAAVLGFIFIAVSRLAASHLPETKTYTYPESLARHYAQVSNNVFEGGTFGDGQPVEFKKSIPVDSANPVTTIEVETTSIPVELLPSETDAIEISLVSNHVDPKEPVLIDASHGSTLRILAQEAGTNLSNVRTWFVFNFDDSTKPKRRNVLEVRVPKAVTAAQIRTVSGNGKLATALTTLQFQSTSGDFEIKTRDNPLARVEHLTMGTTSGNLKGPGRFDHLQFNSVSGDIELDSFDRVLDIDARSTSGNLEIRSSEPVDAAVEFDTTSGDVHVSKAATGGASFKKSQNFKLGKGTAKIKFKSISGDLNLRGPSSKQRREKKGSTSRSGTGAGDGSDSDTNFDDRDSDDASSSDPDDEASLRSNDERSFGAGGPKTDNEESARSKLAARSVVLPAELPHEFRSADSSFLECVAKIAIAEDSRIGATSVKRCVKFVAGKPAVIASVSAISG